LNSQPVKFLEGTKIYLRPYEPEDADFLYHSLYSAEGRRLTGTQQIFTKAATADLINKIAGDTSRVDLVICSLKTNQTLGEVVLNNIDFINRSANIRIGIFNEKDYSQGYGREALVLMLNHAFGGLNLHRVELGVYDFNERAIHVYKQLGFKQEGVLRDSLHFNHRFHNQIIMSILAEEFRHLHYTSDPDPA
jgi:RimJ/RimL family protein N-acetyltransferase